MLEEAVGRADVRRSEPPVRPGELLRFGAGAVTSAIIARRASPPVQGRAPPSSPSKKIPEKTRCSCSPRRASPASDSEQEKSERSHRDAERNLEALLERGDEHLGERTARAEVDLPGDALEIGAARGDDRERAARLRRKAAQELRVGFRENGLTAGVALEPAGAPGRVDFGHGGSASARSAHEDGMHGDAFRFRARDRDVDTALEVLAVGKHDGVPAARRSGREEIGRRREARGE